MRDSTNGSEEEHDQGRIPDVYILMCKGPFCTPRSVVKNMTIRKRPKVEEIVECMKNLSEDNVGKFEKISQKERAYYKPLPEEEIKEVLSPLIGSGKWDEYVLNFKTFDTQYVTSTQHNRLLRASPYTEDEKEAYGIQERNAN